MYVTQSIMYIALPFVTYFMAVDPLASFRFLHTNLFRF